MKAAEFKAKWNYDRQAPICANCKCYRAPHWTERNGSRERVPGMCSKGGFKTCKNALCDVWQGRNGDMLEA